MRAVATIALSLLLVSPAAMAQVPNPFEAYEEGRHQPGAEAGDTGEASEEGDDAACDCPEPAAESVEPEELTPAFEAGRWNAGVDMTFARTSSRNELLDGPDVSERTLFSRFDLSAGYMLRDSLEVGANLGLVGRRVQRGESDAATEVLFAFQPMARYHLAVTHRFSAHGHASVGGFFGRSNRELTINTEDGPQEFQARTTTRGVILSGGAGVGYRISEELQVRFGFDATWLWGREQVPSTEDSLSSSTNHVGATAGARYFF